MEVGMARFDLTDFEWPAISPRLPNKPRGVAWVDDRRVLNGIANPDVVMRLFLDAPLMPVNRELLYGGSEQGYTDYPILRVVSPHSCYYDSERAWG
jgi:hypothetical protein